MYKLLRTCARPRHAQRFPHRVSLSRLNGATPTSAATWQRVRAVADKTNEITAIPDLLSLLELKGAGVSLDAIGCQKTMAEQIVKAEADYRLALKDNHSQLSEDVRRWLDTEVAHGRLLPAETVERDHERLKIRRYALSNAGSGCHSSRSGPSCKR